MRLLNCNRFLRGESDALIEFLDDDNTPPYYILSHRWGEDELTYKDCVKGRNKTGAGFFKVYNYCQFARARHAKLLEITPELAQRWPSCFVWVDTCCIDKRSSAELSEAINSMWKYYKESWECHVYLQDVPAPQSNGERNAHGEHLEAESEQHEATGQLIKSKWFTRGWTLQELLAPRDVSFLRSDWTVMGHKCSLFTGHPWHGTPRPCNLCQEGPMNSPSLQTSLELITGIGRQYLDNSDMIPTASIARRMSWASSRSTTRKEDEAYCLLGIFNVNMPLLYGEGSKAFRRLQAEILSSSTDQSLFAWQESRDTLNADVGLLADSTRDFHNCSDIEVHLIELAAWPYSLTNLGVELRLQARRIVDDRGAFEVHLPEEDVLSGRPRVQEAYIITLNAFHRYGPESIEPCGMMLYTRDSVPPQLYHPIPWRDPDDGLLELSEDSEWKTFYVKA